MFWNESFPSASGPSACCGSFMCPSLTGWLGSQGCPMWEQFFQLIECLLWPFYVSWGEKNLDDTGGSYFPPWGNLTVNWTSGLEVIQINRHMQVGHSPLPYLIQSFFIEVLPPHTHHCLWFNCQVEPPRLTLTPIVYMSIPGLKHRHRNIQGQQTPFQFYSLLFLYCCRYWMSCVLISLMLMWLRIQLANLSTLTML